MTTAERTIAPLEQPVEKGNRTPGLAAILSTVILLVTYALVVTSIQAFAGVGATGTGLGNLANASDVLSVQGSAIFGSSGFGPVFTHLLLLMVLSSGALIIADAVIAIGLFIAFYYGLTGFACAWYYRKNLTSSARNLWMQGILPVAGGLMLYFLDGWSLRLESLARVQRGHRK